MIEYKGYVICKNSRFYYVRILTNKCLITLTDEQLEQLKEKMDEYLDR